MVTLNIRRNSNLTLFKALDTFSARMDWRLGSMIVPVTALTTYFEWLGDLPAVKEWVGMRVLEGLKKHNFNITAKKWENTLEIKTDDLKDNGDVIRPRVEMMAFGAAKHPNKLFYDMLIAGTSGLGFDGTAFFGASHPIDFSASVNSNLISGAGVDTLAHLTTDWNKVKVAFASLTDRSGNPIFDDMGGIHVFHSPYYTDVFEQLFNSAANTAGVVNPYYKQAVPHAAPWLGVASSDNDWYALKLDMPIKPMIFAELEALNTNPPESGWNENDVFMKGIVYFGAMARYNMAYGFWQLAQKVVN